MESTLGVVWSMALESPAETKSDSFQNWVKLSDECWLEVETSTLSLGSTVSLAWGGAQQANSEKIFVDGVQGAPKKTNQQFFVPTLLSQNGRISLSNKDPAQTPTQEPKQLSQSPDANCPQPSDDNCLQPPDANDPKPLMPIVQNLQMLSPIPRCQLSPTSDVHCSQPSNANYLQPSDANGPNLWCQVSQTPDANCPQPSDTHCPNPQMTTVSNAQMPMIPTLRYQLSQPPDANCPNPQMCLSAARLERKAKDSFEES